MSQNTSIHAHFSAKKRPRPTANRNEQGYCALTVGQVRGGSDSPNLPLAKRAANCSDDAAPPAYIPQRNDRPARFGIVDETPQRQSAAIQLWQTPYSKDSAHDDLESIRFRFDDFIPQTTSGASADDSLASGSKAFMSQQDILVQPVCADFVATPRKQLFPRDAESTSTFSSLVTPGTPFQQPFIQSDSDGYHNLLEELSTGPSQPNIVPVTRKPSANIAPTGSQTPQKVQAPARHIPADIQTQLAIISNQKQPTEHERGLGIWKFDKKKKKRMYVALDGRVWYGGDAFRAAKDDHQLLTDQCMSPSQALRQLCASSPRNLQDIVASGVSIDQLGAWGVPAVVVDRYAERGVRQLFQWQVDCLSTANGAALAGKNLVYSAPTSGGKTMVAEIMMIRTLGFKGGIVLFVVPYVSLAEEKTEYFQNIWSPLHLGVRSFHSEATAAGTSLTSDVSLAICTIERANMLLNQLFAENRLQELSMVVVDEMHMVDDPQRGFLLEVLLSKLRYAAKHVQIVGLSATLPNMPIITDWLDAILFTTAFRPVQLMERLCIGRTLYVVNEQRQLVTDRVVGNSSGVESMQIMDVMTDLCMETLSVDGSILIFCPTKKACVSEAEALARYLARQTNRSSGSILRKRHDILAKLADTSVGLCPVLAETILQGVAYHHAGLTLEERKAVEDGYRQGFIKILATTSTLAAGVNLPARRVIIRKAWQGNIRLDVRVFRQMCGRAGRFGLDNHGEAILMSTKSEEMFATNLFAAELPPLRSALLDGAGGGVERIILEMISGGAVKTEDEVRQFLEHTLFARQSSGDRLDMAASTAIQFLLQNRFVQLSPSVLEGRQELSALQPGQACFRAGMSPYDAVEVLCSLSQAQKRLILSTDFHLVYLVTPPHPPFQPDWDSYARAYSKLSNAERLVADTIGISEVELARIAMARNVAGLAANTKTMYLRFYAALLLYQLVQEKPMKELTGSMAMSRGQLQAFHKAAGSFCAQVRKFCEHLNWNLLESVLAPFEQRLGFGVQEELLPLVRIGPEVPAFRARALHTAGFCTPAAIVAADQQAIHQVLVDSMPFSADLDITEEFKNDSKSISSTRRISNQDVVRHHIALCWKLTRVIRQKAINLTEMEERLKLREEQIG